jgi:L-phenylalanine/L-methionine N-acetyltransferase
MELLIRPVNINDAHYIHQILSQERVMPYVISLPSDRVEQLEDRYRTLPKNNHELVAQLDDVVVGHAGLVQLSGRRSHVGTFYIAVDTNYHGKGIGTALITKILDLADNWLMLERIELGVLVTNPRAQVLYERHGFVVEGKKTAAIRSAGQYVDEVVMSRLRPKGILNR